MNIPHLRVGIELARLEKENATLHAELTTARERIAELEANQVTSDAITSLEGYVVTAQERDQLRAELAAAKYARQPINIHPGSSTKYAGCTTGVSQWSAKDQLADFVTRLRDERDRLEAENARLRDELDAIKAELAGAVQMIKLGTEGAIRLIDIEDERDRLRTQLAAAREALKASQVQAEMLRCSIILFFGSDDIDILHRGVNDYDKALAAITRPPAVKS